MTIAQTLGFTPERHKQLSTVFDLALAAMPHEFKGYELHQLLLKLATTPGEAYYLAMKATAYLEDMIGHETDHIYQHSAN